MKIVAARVGKQSVLKTFENAIAKSRAVVALRGHERHGLRVLRFARIIVGLLGIRGIIKTILDGEVLRVKIRRGDLQRETAGRSECAAMRSGFIAEIIMCDDRAFAAFTEEMNVRAVNNQFLVVLAFFYKNDERLRILSRTRSERGSDGCESRRAANESAGLAGLLCVNDGIGR